METFPGTEVLQALEQQSQTIILQELHHPVAVIVLDALPELDQVLEAGVPEPRQEVDGVGTSVRSVQFILGVVQVQTHHEPVRPVALYPLLFPLPVESSCLGFSPSFSY